MPQKDPAPSWAIWRSLDFFEFFQNYTPPWGGGFNPKKYFEVAHRVQGEVHAKFGWNPASSLGAKSEQTNKQTDRQTDRQASFIYIDWLPFTPPPLQKQKDNVTVTSGYARLNHPEMLDWIAKTVQVTDQ